VSGEGFSLTAANLAVTRRARATRGALVGCELRRGGLAQAYSNMGSPTAADVINRQERGG